MINGVSKTIESEVKEKNVEKNLLKKSSLLGNIFLGKVVIQAIAASLLGNIFSGKGVIQASEETIKAGQGFQCHFIL